MAYQFRRSSVLFAGLLLLVTASVGGAALAYGLFAASLVALYDVTVIAWVVWNWGLEVVFKPTDLKTARIMLEAARTAPGEMVCDLGAGDGRLLVMAARRYGVSGLGVEIDPLRCWAARLLIRVFGLHHKVRIWQGNLRDIDISAADVVLMYLSLDVNADLRNKLSCELKEQARVVSYVYPVVGWEPVEVLPSAQAGENIYLYHSHSWSQQHGR